MRNNKINKLTENASITMAILPKEEYIEKLSLEKNEISVTNRNKKTGSCVLDIAFPTCVCREDAPCHNPDGCYCMKGTQQIARVLQAYYRNLRLYKENKEDFFEQMAFKFKHFNTDPKIRLFDCGDLPDVEFLPMFIEKVCKIIPEGKFMFFTKRYDFVNDYLDKGGEIPSNLNIVFSAWDKSWEVPNPYGLPMAYVDFNNKNLNCEIPANAFYCLNQKDKTITCSGCGYCWNKNMKAVVFKQH